MAATTQTQSIQSKRRRSRLTTITATTLDSSTAAAATCTTQNHTHIVISPDDTQRREPPPPPPLQSDLQIQSPPSTMGSYGQDSFPSSLSKFNSALTAGLLNPMSPPPRISPTLFEMMANDAEMLPRASAVGVAAAQNLQNSTDSADPPPQDKQQRLMDLLASWSPVHDLGASDVQLTLSSKDGVSVTVSVHRQILAANSRFFASRLNNQQRSYVEIADCDDIEVYIETLRLMYCKDLRKKLMKEGVPRVLGILKVSAAIEFDAGVVSCLEYLEAAPWAEDEEEKVASLLSELRLQGVEAGEVLKRVSLDSTRGLENGNDNEQVLLKLLQVVLEGKDEKARREMKGLVTKLLRENSSQNDLRKESLYSACDGCLKSLSCHLLNAAQGDVKDVGQIARQADNLHWLLDILMDRQIGEEFLMIWASQSELSEAHSRVAPIHRHDVSGITARLFVGIGKKQVLASKEARCLLLKTWLVPFYEDFGWMRRATRGLDRHLIEEGLSGTISTLPMALQQEIFLSWFNRFLNGGDDCPNIQRGFQLWWKRAFRRQNGEVERPRQMRVVDSMGKSWI